MSVASSVASHFQIGCPKVSIEGDAGQLPDPPSQGVGHQKTGSRAPGCKHFGRPGPDRPILDQLVEVPRTPDRVRSELELAGALALRDFRDGDLRSRYGPAGHPLLGDGLRVGYGRGLGRADPADRVVKVQGICDPDLLAQCGADLAERQGPQSAVGIRLDFSDVLPQPPAAIGLLHILAERRERRTRAGCVDRR